ncbi:MAG: hypothetical protein J6Q83_01440 [Clostridia bacterium]|nr:hypothetical protein [Clostridia bacterium]
MKDLIIIVIVALIFVLALAYVIRKKKQGVKCIGCPYAKDCAQKSNSCSCNTK